MLTELKSLIERLEKKLGEGVRIEVEVGFRTSLNIRISQLYKNNLNRVQHTFTKEEICSTIDESILINYLEQMAIQKLTNLKIGF